MDNRREIGKRIREVRTRLGKSQADFGEVIGGLKKSAVSTYEAGDSMPTVEALSRIAEIGGVTLDWLITGKEEEAPAFPVVEDLYPHDGAVPLPNAIEKDLVRVVIEAVEEGLGDLHLELKPDKKAQLVITLCEMFQEEKQVDKPTILRLIKLAA
jgi:transcriptional regulator with XRE-family HTH domain